jgi:hypothetical protein
VNLRQAYLQMIKAFPGGWDGMAAALGMTRDALENRIYERKGQSVLVETALQMQAFSQTTCFVDAVAASSGGTFIRLPPADQVGNEDLFAKFRELHVKLGELTAKWSEFTKDDELDDGECAKLSAVRDEIHKTMDELMGMSFLLYRKGGAKQA